MLTSSDKMLAELMHTAKTSACVVVSTLILALGCGGGTQLEGQHFESDDFSFRVGPVPDGWRRIDVDQALLAFRDDTQNATIAVNGRCGKDGDDVPLTSLTHHLFLYFTDRNVLAQKEVPLAGREALRTEMTAKLDGVQKHYVVYVLKKNGCVYDFMHIADQTTPDASRQAFDRFVQGFSTVG